MAVTPVGQNRPQVPAQLEAPETAAQKSGAGGAGATAQAQATVGGQENAVQAELARDAFDRPTNHADQAQALGGADQVQQDDQFTQALNSLVQALSSVVELVKSFLPPEAQNPEEAVGTPAPGTDPLDGRGGGPGDRNPLGLPGPGGPGTGPGAFGVPGINQNDPNLDGDNSDYKFGQTNCAPTALAEIARGRSLEDPNYSLSWKDEGGNLQSKKVADMTNEELVTTLGTIAHTDKDGTSGNGLIDAASAMGLEVTNDEVKADDSWKPGQGPSHSFDQAWLDQKLNDGEKVVINGAYEGKDEKGNDALIGHFMTIAGKNDDGTYAVVDPWDGKQKNLSADQLARFMQANPANGGIMFAIGDTPAERAWKAGQGQPREQAEQVQQG